MAAACRANAGFSTMNSSVASLRFVPAPHPNQRVRQRLLEHLPIAVLRRSAEDVTVVVALGFQGRGSPFVGHHPIVIGFLWIVRPNIVLRDVREDPQRLLLAGFDQFLTGM